MRSYLATVRIYGEDRNEARGYIAQLLWGTTATLIDLQEPGAPPSSNLLKEQAILAEENG